MSTSQDDQGDLVSAFAAREIEQLIRERDLARTVAVEAMRTMHDGQLAELRQVLSSRGLDDTAPDGIPAVIDDRQVEA
jgi:hypothetical protein